MKTVHIYAVIEVQIPQGLQTRSLHLGLAGSKILDNFRVVEDAKLGTWWVEDVKACNLRYCTCPQCGKIEMVCADAVILDGKPLCIHCSAKFVHGDLPTPRTTDDIKTQLAPRGAGPAATGTSDSEKTK